MVPTQLSCGSPNLTTRKSAKEAECLSRAWECLYFGHRNLQREEDRLGRAESVSRTGLTCPDIEVLRCFIQQHSQGMTLPRFAGDRRNLAVNRMGKASLMFRKRVPFQSPRFRLRLWIAVLRKTTEFTVPVTCCV